MDEVHKAIGTLEKELGKKFGDQQEPVAGFRPFRCGRLDAGHDEHDS